MAAMDTLFRHYFADGDLELGGYRVQALVQNARSAFARNAVFPHLGDVAALSHALHDFTGQIDQLREARPGVLDGVDTQTGETRRGPSPFGAPLHAEAFARWACELLDPLVHEGQTILSFAQHEVTLDVVARKLRADSVGRETEVPMNDLVEIGVFAPATGDGPGEPLYLQRHRIRSGRQTIRVSVPRAPARAPPRAARICSANASARSPPWSWTGSPTSRWPSGSTSRRRPWSITWHESGSGWAAPAGPSCWTSSARSSARAWRGTAAPPGAGPPPRRPAGGRRGTGRPGPSATR